MYRLLIVDNEEYVVNGLVELFNSDEHQELEAAGAYSAAQALNVLMTTKMDIVITDIRMPGMNGLELQKIIAARWPYCKVIFLSGYDDFSYAQEAIRNGSVNYILKTEPDNVIIDAVYRSIDVIRGEKETQNVIEKAQNQLKQALPALQREYLQSLLIGDKQAYQSLDSQLEQLNIPLSPDKPVYVVVGKVDEWPQDFSHYSRSLLLYAVQNISNEYLSLSTIHYSFIHERFRIVWLIQSKAEPWMEKLQSENKLTMTAHFVYGTFECVQSSCLDVLHLPLSFAIGNQAVPWQELGEELESLLDRIKSTVKKQQLFMEQENKREAETNKVYSLQHEVFKHYEHLSYCLEHKNKEDFFRKLDFLIQAGEKARYSNQPMVCVQIASSVLSILFGYLEKLRIEDIPAPIADIKASYESGKLDQWEGQREQLRTMAEYVFMEHVHAEESEENRIVQNIHAYLATNLGGDLSLKTMAFSIGHNPSYLSRLYKQKAGKGLSETIMELKLSKAKQLLAEPQYRIQDISKAVGFLSDHYFYRFFKKAMKLTPQEYREQLNVNGR